MLPFNLEKLTTLYGKEQRVVQEQRYHHLAECFCKGFGNPEKELRIFSAPGQIELGGKPY